MGNEIGTVSVASANFEIRAPKNAVIPDGHHMHLVCM